MKKLFLFFSFLIFGLTTIAQVPQAFSYKAQIKDNYGNHHANKKIGLKISILQNNVEGQIVYIEKHQVNTSPSGIVDIEIGRGIPLLGLFSEIDWKSWPYFVKVELDLKYKNDYKLLAITELLSVPYAQYAGNAANGFSGNYNDLQNKPNIPSNISELLNDEGFIKSEIDPEFSKSLAKDITATDTAYWNSKSNFNGDYGYLKNKPVIPTKTSELENNSGFIVNEADGNPTNELQFLRLSNDTVYLSQGGFVKLPNDYNLLANKPDLSGIDASRKKIETMNGSFENFDQKTNQLYNILSTVMKTIDEMESGITRNIDSMATSGQETQEAIENYEAQIKSLSDRLSALENIHQPTGVDVDKDGFTVEKGDCNDNDPGIYPDAKEICGDGIDQDCNGSDLQCIIDSDGDGIADANDNCPNLPNPDQLDSNGDGVGDACSAIAFLPGTSFDFASDVSLLKHSTNVIILDAFEATAQQVTALKQQGVKIMAHLSVGTFQDWRADAHIFPQDLLGMKLTGFPGERWLNIKNLNTLLPIIKSRIDIIKSKGFDGLFIDKIDAFKDNSGFSITLDDELQYCRAILGEAKSQNLLVGQANAIELCSIFSHEFDCLLVERAFQYSEQQALTAYIDSGKPVFDIEYIDKYSDNEFINNICTQSGTLKISCILKISPNLETIKICE